MKLKEAVRKKKKQGKNNLPPPSPLKGNGQEKRIIKLSPGVVVFNSGVLQSDFIIDQEYNVYFGKLQETPEGFFFEIEVVYYNSEVGKLLEGDIDAQGLRAIHLIKKKFNGEIKTFRKGVNYDRDWRS